MSELLRNGLFAVVLTLITFRAAQWIQAKLRSPLLNPILVSTVMILVFMSLTGYENEVYQVGADRLTWLITPATVCLAIPMYEQLSILGKNWKAILAGIAAGAVASLVMVLLFCLTVGFDRTLTVSLLPKSVTSAIGVPLSQISGGIGAITTPVIIITGIIAGSLSESLFQLLKITDPIAQGVALGTAGHVVGTSKATEMGPLTGAVSSLSLVVAGLLTSVLFPIAVSFVP